MKFLLRALCALLLSMSTALAAIDANTATVEQLQMITGVGPTIARRIVDERRHGAYRSLDDLQARVKGIGETSIRKMAAAGLTVGPGRAKGEQRPESAAEPKVETRPPPAARAEPARRDEPRK